MPARWPMRSRSWRRFEPALRPTCATRGRGSCCALHGALARFFGRCAAVGGARVRRLEGNRGRVAAGERQPDKVAKARLAAPLPELRERELACATELEQHVQ